MGGGGGGGTPHCRTFYYTKLCSSLYWEVRYTGKFVILGSSLYWEVRYIRGLLYRETQLYVILHCRVEKVKGKGKADFH